MAQHPALTEGRVAVITWRRASGGSASPRPKTLRRDGPADLSGRSRRRPARTGRSGSPPSLRGAARRMCWPCRPTSVKLERGPSA